MSSPEPPLAQTSELFDLERLRRNWREPASAIGSGPTRFDQVATPLDLHTAALAQLAHLQSQCQGCFPEQREHIERFLSQIELAVHAALAEAERVDPAAPSGEQSATAQLVDLLWRFEELLEVYLLLGR